MNIAQYLDSTYLKTPLQAGISEEETLRKVKELTQEAIENHLFAVMIRPDYVAEIRKYILEIRFVKSAICSSVRAAISMIHLATFSW